MVLTPSAANQMPTTGQAARRSEGTAVVEGGVLEDQATEVTVGSHDVVGLPLGRTCSRSSGLLVQSFHG